MSALSEREYLAEEICELFTKLTGDEYAEDLARARKLAEGGNPHDHWLHTTRLDYESRLFMAGHCRNTHIHSLFCWRQ